MSPRPHPPKLVRLARALWGRGIPAREIAKLLSTPEWPLTKNAIIGMTDRNEFPVRPTVCWKWTTKADAMLRRQWLDGVSRDEIAARMTKFFGEPTSVSAIIARAQDLHLRRPKGFAVACGRKGAAIRWGRRSAGGASGLRPPPTVV